MLHVSVIYRGRRAVGMFLEQEHWIEAITMREAGQRGAVPALDHLGRRCSLVVHDLAADPVVLGYGADPLHDGPTFDPATSPPPRRTPARLAPPVGGGGASTSGAAARRPEVLRRPPAWPPRSPRRPCPGHR